MGQCIGSWLRRMGERRVFWMLGLVLALVSVVGCSQNPTPTPTAQKTAEPTAVPVQSTPVDTRVLPTVYPTSSPFPTPLPTDPRPTSTPRPTATPIDFTELVVEVHYAIPGLQLSRTLRGNVSSQLELEDETTGKVVPVTDVPGVMFELQQTLPEAELSEVPDGCDLCVQLSYELFLTGESGSGWLKDPILLASFENFFSAHLGPYFPPDTIVGLRRGATPYDVAHTVAVLAGGEMWRWTATEPEVSGPEVEAGNVPLLLNDLDLDPLGQEYLGPCPEGSGFEQMLLRKGETERSIEITCPELSLPLPLLPLYLQIDALSDAKTADTQLDAPEPTVPLESVVYYQRGDGSHLILFANGRARATSGDGLVAEADLAENQTIDTALTLSESGNMAMGVISLVSGDNQNVLIARGLDGVYEVGWNDAPPANLSQVIEELNNLLADLLENAEAPAEGTPTATINPDATPGEGTPTLTPSGEETPEPTPTQ